MTTLLPPNTKSGTGLLTLSTTYTYNVASQLINRNEGSAGGTNFHLYGYVYTYDGNGSVRTETNNLSGGGGEVTTYGYDSRNRLTSWQKQAKGATLATARFSYDGTDSRLGLFYNGQTTSYLQDTATGNEVVLQEIKGSSRSSFLYPLGSTSPLYQSDASGNGLWYHSDGLGSIRALTNGSTGTLVNTNSYSAFGTSTGATGKADNNHLFAGEQLDPTGLYYNRARYYNPNLGRFISRDMVMGQPLHPQSMNPYSYVQNNPALYTDPTGHFAFLPLLLIAVNAAFLVLDTQELIKTWSDPNSSLLDRGLAIGSVALDLVGIGAEVKGIVGAAKVGAKATEALGKILGVTTKAGETGKIGSEGGKVVTKVGGEAGKATHVEKTITGADKVGDTGRTVDSSSSAIGQCSFSSDTPVATSNGEKPIGEIQVGEQVLAYNEASGTNGNYTVQAVLINNDPAEVFLTIDGERIETTPEHPWYTEDKGWINAGDLRIGEHIRKANGESGEVQSLEFVRKPKVMYNLTVDQAHTFFVGEQRWLVHNAGSCTSRLTNVVKKYGAKPEIQGEASGYKFTNRREARQAASEVIGDLGSNPETLRKSDFRGGPHTWKNSAGVIGKQSADGTVGWRDDVLGHSAYGMGSHVNVWGLGVSAHFWY